MSNVYEKEFLRKGRRMHANVEKAGSVGAAYGLFGMESGGAF